RRRHTRWPRDWSSDVCSSDLRTQLRERGLDRGAAALVMLGRPGLRRERELVPAIEPRLAGGEETVDALGTRRDSLHDHFSCGWWFQVSAARILSGRTTVGNRTLVVPWGRTLEPYWTLV